MPDALLWQPSQFMLACDRHRNMLDCIPSGLVYKTDPREKEITRAKDVLPNINRTLPAEINSDSDGMVPSAAV